MSLAGTLSEVHADEHRAIVVTSRTPRQTATSKGIVYPKFLGTHQAPHTSCTLGTGCVRTKAVSVSCAHDWRAGARALAQARSHLDECSEPASFVAAVYVESHFPACTRVPWATSSFNPLSTARHAAGDSRTRAAQPPRSCSRTGSRSTICRAIAPFLAARRSSYAARRHRCEHQVGQRPVALKVRRVPHLGQVVPSFRERLEAIPHGSLRTDGSFDIEHRGGERTALSAAARTLLVRRSPGTLASIMPRACRLPVREPAPRIVGTSDDLLSAVARWAPSGPMQSS